MISILIYKYNPELFNSSFVKVAQLFETQRKKEITMALPLIPFVTGAAVGCIATHLYRDDEIREELKKKIDRLSNKGDKAFNKARESLLKALKGKSPKDKE